MAGFKQKMIVKTLTANEQKYPPQVYIESPQIRSKRENHLLCNGDSERLKEKSKQTALKLPAEEGPGETGAPFPPPGQGREARVCLQEAPFLKREIKIQQIIIMNHSPISTILTVSFNVYSITSAVLKNKHSRFCTNKSF